jgi:FkbM family methyltransferase
MSYRGQSGLVHLLDQEGRSAKILIRPNTDDDIVVDEVWRENVYRMHSDHVIGGIVLDVGANIGAFSLWAGIAGAKKVVAFEPEASNFKQLQENTRLVPVEARNVALGFASGYGSITNNEVASGSGYVVEGNDFAVESFADVLRQFSEIAVLKMDIEGGEYDCFDSIDASSLSGVRRLVMEFHGPDVSDIPNFEARFGHMLTTIAEWGHLEVLGRPSTGGMIYGIRY